MNWIYSCIEVKQLPASVFLKFYFSFLQNYTPTSFDKTVSELLVDNQRVSFVIWDTSG